MNQEAIFRFIGSAGLGGGFAAGSRLPKEKGNLKNFKIVRLSAVNGETVDVLVSRLVQKLSEKPTRGLEARGRQLKALIERYTGNGKNFVLIISKAHLLQRKTLRNLKSIHEFGTIEGSYPGFFLQGDMEQIVSLLIKEPSIKTRTVLLP